MFLYFVLYFVVYFVYLQFYKNKISLSSILLLYTLIIYTLILFFLYVDIYKYPKCIYDTKIQTDTCFDNINNYINKISVVTLKYIFIYIPSVLLLFYILKIRNTYSPFFNKKLNIFLFILLYFIFSFITEFISYINHRILHLKLFFKFHEEHHKYISPCAFSALDGSPVEIFFWNLLPSFIAPFIFGIDIYFVYTIILFGLITSILSHAGYRIIDLGFINNAHHDLHHERMKCNYSSPIIDYLMGTYIYREPKKFMQNLIKKLKIFQVVLIINVIYNE